ncbi:MAG: hypothetical protein ABI867_29980 [Kofleriaceae bacterium]
MKLVGVAWLVLAVGFVIAALCATFGVTGWPVLTIALACGSIVMCGLQLPETMLGLMLDVLIIAAVLTDGYFGWI